MYHVITFDHGVTAATVRDVIIDQFDFDATRVFAGSTEELERSLRDGASYPAVTVIQERGVSGQFTCELESSEEFAQDGGELDTLALATALCKALDTRALIEDGGDAPSSYMLVTSDGWHGRVVLDDAGLDEGVMDVAFAFQPVPSDPSIPVEEPPEWQAGWYPDRQVPTSGYLFPEDRPEAPPEGDARQ